MKNLHGIIELLGDILDIVLIVIMFGLLIVLMALIVGGQSTVNIIHQVFNR